MRSSDLLEKIKGYECYLLGQIPLNNDEIEEVMNYAKNIISLEDRYIIEGPDLILSTALVQIAISEYQDGKYWEVLKNKLNIENISGQKQGILGRIFIRTLREYKLFELKENLNGSMRYVENIKAHAFITNNYMERFYDFLYDYYDNNLFRDISNGVEDTLQDLSDYIKTTLKQDNDTVYSNNNGKTKKSYKLLKSTREVIAQLNGNVLYQLFYPSLKIIDKNFYEGVLPKDGDSNRFARIFCEWYKNTSKKEEFRNRAIKERKFYSSKPYIVLNINPYSKGPFTLVIPKRRYRTTECDGNVYVTVTMNGISRHPKQLEVSTSMGTYISEEYRMAINYPFDEIKIEISSRESNEIILEGNEYVIFNEKCIKVNRFEKGINYLLVKSEVQVKFPDERIIIEREQYEEWEQYKLNIADDSICYINNKPLTIIGEFSKEPIFEKKINFYTVYNEKGNNIVATRTHPLISFEIDRTSLIGATIKINNKNYPLTSNNINKYDSPINSNQLIISTDLNNIIDKDNGYYKVELNIPGKSNDFITEYLLLDNVFFIFDRPRYIYETEAKLTLKTNGMDIILLDDKCENIYCNEYRCIYYYSFKLSAEYRNINAKLILEEGIFLIKVPIKMMLYGFSEYDLNYGRAEEIWYNKLRQVIYVKFPEIKEIGMYSNIDYNKIVWGEQIKDDLFRINITQLIQDIKDSKNQYQCLYVRYIDNKARFLSLYKVIKNIKIVPYFEFEYFKDELCFNVEFQEVEGVKIYYSICEEDENNKEIIKKRELKPGVNFLPEIERDRYYTIMPILEESDEFHLNNIVKTLPKRSHKGIISFEKSKGDTIYDFEVIGKKLEILSVNFKYNKLELNPMYYYYVRILGKNSDGTFNGKLYEYYTESNKKNDSKDKRRVLGIIRLYNLKRYGKDEFIFFIENYSNMDNDWYELYYYKENNRLVENDNSILDNATVKELIALEKDNTRYIAKIVR